jgi:hypothetical protein
MLPHKPSSPERWLIVNAGRASHTAVITKVKSQDGVGTVDVMAIYGGLSPNCTDYCPDFWCETPNTRRPAPNLGRLFVLGASRCQKNSKVLTYLYWTSKQVLRYC